jgi:hypothetical protein
VKVIQFGWNENKTTKVPQTKTGQMSDSEFMKTSINGYYARVALSFASKPDTDLIAFARNVITLMTGNTQYPTPLPSLATITDGVNTFETAAVHDALERGKTAILARNAARVSLVAMLRQLAAYVQANCNADLLMLASSGFDAVRAPSPVGVLPAPQNLRLSLTGVSGEMLLRFDRVSNAVNYSVETAASPDGPWEAETPSTSTRVFIEGLTPGQVYWVHVCSNGSAGSGGWSGPVSAMAV